MIRVFHVFSSDQAVDFDRASDFDRAMFARGVLTLSHFVVGSVHEWIADVHPVETAIVIGSGDRGARFACDLAAAAGLDRRPASGVIAVNAPALTHPLRALLPFANPPVLPAGMRGAVVTDPGGPAAFRGNLRAPAAWAHRGVILGSTEAHTFDAVAAAIKWVDRSRPVIAEQFKIAARPPKTSALRFLPPIEAG